MTELLFQYAEAQAQRRPDATAVVLGDRHVSYGELSETSDRLAHLLRAGGLAPGDRVCIVMPKSPMALIAMHAVMKAGGAYVPVDASSPAARVARVFAASEPRWILASGSAGDLLEAALEDHPHRLPGVGWLDDAPAEGATYRISFGVDDIAAHAADPLRVEGHASDAAHLLFTSGSTGAPKGVIITHANVIAFIEWAVDYFGMSASDRVSGHSPLHFDLSTFDIYGAFAAGAELHQVPAEVNLMAPKLAAFIRDARLTQWFSVPSILSYMAKFDAVAAGDFPDLERLLWCGETFPTSPLMHWMERLPHVAFTNLYGPTEATIASSYHTLHERPRVATEAIPIGQPCRGEGLLVLDERLATVARGEVGDLYLSGVGLSPGYWQDPENTAAAFRTRGGGERVYRTGDLASVGADSLVYFHGRTDTQIKSRGHRIELGEIEAALNTMDDLRESAVVAIDTDGFEGSSICCAYVPAVGAEVSPLTLRKALRAMVPSYMLPSKWLDMERLPRNANGKTDKPAIRTRFEEAA